MSFRSRTISTHQLTNQNSKEIHVADAKRGKTWASKLEWFWPYFWLDDKWHKFFKPIPWRKPRQMRITLHTQEKTILNHINRLIYSWKIGDQMLISNSIKCKAINLKRNAWRLEGASMGHSWNKRRGREKQRYPYDKYMNPQNTFAFKSVTKYILSNIIKYYTSILKLHSEICLSMSSCLSGQQFASDFQSRKLNLLLS